MLVLEKVPTSDLCSLIKELLDKHKNVRIKVTGSSMLPFLRHLKNSVELSQISFLTLHNMDIVLIQRNSNQYILHRVVRLEKDRFFVSGDAQSIIEGPLYPDQLVAVVVAVWRGNKRISCKDPWWRILSYLWLLLLPYRTTILRLAKKGKDLLHV